MTIIFKLLYLIFNTFSIYINQHFQKIIYSTIYNKKGGFYLKKFHKNLSMYLKIWSLSRYKILQYLNKCIGSKWGKIERAYV